MENHLEGEMETRDSCRDCKGDKGNEEGHLEKTYLLNLKPGTPKPKPCELYTDYCRDRFLPSLPLGGTGGLSKWVNDG